MKRLARGFLGRAFFISITDVALKGSTAILALILARFLGPTDFGMFAAAIAAADLIMISGSIGYEQEMIRRSATAPLSESLTLTQAWVAVTVVVALITLAVYEGFFSSVAVPATLLVLAVTVNVVSRFQLPFRYAGIILGETHVAAVIHSVATAVLLVLTLLVLWLARSAAAVLSVQIAVAVATVLAWEIWRHRRGIPYQFPPGGMAEAVKFLKRALSFAVTNILWVMYFNVQIVLLTSLGPKSDVGVYSAIYRMVAMMFILGYAITSSYSPSLFAAAHADPGKYQKLATRMMLTLLGGGAAVSLCLGLAARTAIVLVMGPAFERGVGAAHVLALAGFLRILNFGFSEMLTTAGRHRWRIGVESGLLAVNVGLNFLWIPTLGPLGAARAALGAEMAMTASGLVLWEVIRRFPKGPQPIPLVGTLVPDAPGTGYDK